MTYYKFNRLWIVSIDFIIQLKFKLNNLLGDWIVLHDMKKNQINVEGKWKKKSSSEFTTFFFYHKFELEFGSIKFRSLVGMNLTMECL